MAGIWNFWIVIATVDGSDGSDESDGVLDVVFCCDRCNENIGRESDEHNRCITAGGDKGLCQDCRIFLLSSPYDSY
jgi:hypothetical protein